MATSKAILILLATIATVFCQTPVIGGSCKLGTADVQIGGKQTQFFLKCESASDSADGEGVWVVKSRAAAAAAAQAVPAENVQPQQRPPMRKMSNPNICEQDNGARSDESCAVSATCLQANNDDPTNYLQCDQTNMRWIRKSCQDGFVFNFEQQTCITPRRMSSFSRQQPSSGLVCTFSSCSNSNPCSSGTCNNGYCCSSGSSSNVAPIIVQQASSGCVGCNQQAPQIYSMPTTTCPGGAYSVGSCNSGYCSPGYSCISGSCCPSYSAPAPSINVYSCPTGGSAVGACISGSCATGYSCIQNRCCPATTTKNPFVCPDGNQAAGGCVNGQCGTGYTCNNGLCCTGTSTSIRCLDGSEAVGACIPSCQGDACGRSTVSYYCGSGYTCTTGNICCPINSCPNGGEPLGPTVNGLCPTGYTVQGSLCCSATCTDGTAGTPAVNGVCPTGTTLTNGVCCTSTTTTAATTFECADTVSIGPCVNGACANVGYGCNAAGTLCCPAVNIVDTTFQLGPGVAGMCPSGYAIVYLGTQVDATTGQDAGVCIDVQSIPGVCATDTQNGPCSAGVCSTGFTCFTLADVCCPSATFSRLRPGQRVNPMNQNPSYGRPLNSYMPPRELACPDGSSAGGACMNGLCGVGHECVNNLCCPPQKPGSGLKSMCPNGETAVSGCFTGGTCGTNFECVKSINLCCPPGGNDIAIPSQGLLTIRPIGARCQQDVECVGNGEGLSMCHAGVCQCSPIAYSQGIACVRRKALRLMNDSPMEAIEKNEVPSK